MLAKNKKTGGRSVSLFVMEVQMGVHLEQNTKSIMIVKSIIHPRAQDINLGAFCGSFRVIQFSGCSYISEVKKTP